MWQNITDPKTNRSIKIHSQKGLAILRRYIQQLGGQQLGGQQMSESCDELKNVACNDFTERPKTGMMRFFRATCSEKWKTHNEVLEKKCKTKKFNINCRESSIGRACLDANSIVNKITAIPSISVKEIAKSWSALKSFKNSVGSIINFYYTLSDTQIKRFEKLSKKIHSGKATIDEMNDVMTNLSAHSQKVLRTDILTNDSPTLRFIATESGKKKNTISA